MDPAIRASAAQDKDTGEAATSLEAYFLRRILAEVRTGTSVGGKGFAEDMFQEMFHETLADKMADAGGLGLAPMLESQLEAAEGMMPERPETSPAPVVTPTAVGRKYGGTP